MPTPTGLLSITYMELDLPLEGEVALALSGGGTVTVKLLDDKPSAVSLGIDAPREVPVDKAENHETHKALRADAARAKLAAERAKARK